MREIASGNQLHSEALWIALNLIDRFLSKKKLSGAANEFNTITSACIFVAAKLDDERIIQTVDDKDILKMESTVLKTVDWNIPLVSPYIFYYEIVKNFKTAQIKGFKPKTPQLFVMFMDVILEDIRFQAFPPSFIAMSAFLSIHHYIGSRSENGEQPWSKIANFMELTPKGLSSLKKCFDLLSKLIT